MLETRDIPDGFKDQNNISRFWSKIDLFFGITDEDCWNWKGTRIKFGYGVLTAKIGVKQIKRLAHRLSYLYHFKQDPGQMFVCHRCDNSGCVNPNHLFLGTSLDNNRDCTVKGRRAFGKKNGHCTMPERTPKGEDTGMARLNNEKVLEIRKLYQSGVSGCKISRTLKVPKTTTFNILRRRTWKHI